MRQQGTPDFCLILPRAHADACVLKSNDVLPLLLSSPNRLIEYVVLQDPQEKSIKPVFL